MENLSLADDKIDLEAVTKPFKIENKETFVLYLKDIWIVNTSLNIIGSFPEELM